MPDPVAVDVGELVRRIVRIEPDRALERIRHVIAVVVLDAGQIVPESEWIVHDLGAVAVTIAKVGRAAKAPRYRMDANGPAMVPVTRVLAAADRDLFREERAAMRRVDGREAKGALRSDDGATKRPRHDEALVRSPLPKDAHEQVVGRPIRSFLQRRGRP